MKIKSRASKIADYNERYATREHDAETRVREYFESTGVNMDKAKAKAVARLEDILENRTHSTIRITMYEYPMKTDRPRSTMSGHTFSPNAGANKKYFEKAIEQVVRSFNMITTPAEITINAYLEMPRTVPPEEVILFEAKVLNVVDMPDYDNIGKCYTDMITDVIAANDDIFYSGTVNKYYSLLPRVELTITFLDKHESKHVFKKMSKRKNISRLVSDGLLTMTAIDSLK